MREGERIFDEERDARENCQREREREKERERKEKNSFTSYEQYSILLSNIVAWFFLLFYRNNEGPYERVFVRFLFTVRTTLPKNWL